MVSLRGTVGAARGGPVGGAGSGPVAEESAGRGVADYLWLLHRHRWAALGVFLAVAGWGAYDSLTETPVYRSTPAVLEIVSEVSGVTTMTDVLDRQVVSAQHLETQMNLLRSERVLRTAYESDGAFAARLGYDAFVAGVSTAAVRNSFLVHVRFESPVAELNDDAANAVAGSFIRIVRGMRESRNSSASAEFDRRAEVARERLGAADTALDDFRRRAGTTDVRSEKVKLDGQVASLEQRLDEKVLARVEAERAWEEAKAAEGQGQPWALLDVTADTRFAAVDRALAEKEQALRVARTGATEGNRTVAAIEDEIGILKRERDEAVAAVHGRIRRTHEAAAREEQRLRELVDGRRTEQARLGGLLVEQFSLEAAQERCRAEVEEISRRASEVQGATGFDLSPALLWEEARESRTPVRPRHTRDIAGAVLLALFLAAAAVLLLDQFDDAVIHPEVARRVTGLPVLGMLPRVNLGGASADLVSLRDPSSGMAEAIRIIRTGILFAPEGSRERRIILVTSAEMGEGKTLTSTNLAIAMAQAGHRTLLVDCDLRNPRVHRVFSVDNSAGLTSIFSNGQHRPPAHDVAGAGSTLRVTPSGPRPPNPAELVGGPRMAAWLEDAAREYDRVIIDSPPAGPVSDPALLARLVDGVVLVLELGRTSQRALRRAHEHLAKVDAPVLGIVLNGVHMNPRGYYYYYGRYGYGGDRASKPAEGTAAS